MLQCSGDTAMMPAPKSMLGSAQLDYSPLPLCFYRDAIRRVSVSGSLCRWAQFFPPISSDALAGEESYYCWSNSSSASSPTLDASSRCSPVSSSDGEMFFSSRGRAAPDEELRAIALRMVHDGYMKSLIREFSGVGKSSAQDRDLFRGLDPDELLLRSWLKELDVEWVWILHAVEDGDVMQQMEEGCVSLQDFFGESIRPLKTLMQAFSLQDLMERWIRALKTMAQVLCITQVEVKLSLSTKALTIGGFRNAIGYFLSAAFTAGRKAKREQEVVQFLRFAEASVRKMLAFVEAVAAAAVTDHIAPDMLPGMLLVYTCVLDDSPALLASFKEACNTNFKSKFDSVNRLFVQQREKLSDAIWSMMENVRGSFLIDESWPVSPEEFGGVHKSTKLMMNYLMLLSRHEGALDFLLQEHCVRMFMPQDDHYPRLAVHLIEDMISSLERQVEKASNSISDPGMRYIFLMNNCSFISQKVSSLLLPPRTPIEDYEIQSSTKGDARGNILPPMENYINQSDPNLPKKILTDSNRDGLVRIQRYIEAYLDASWDPVLSCLYLPYGVHGYRGALARFESAFQKTYAVQKMWKVPNPELRKRLREAVIEKVVSGYSMYLAERKAMGKSKRSTLSRTPHELEELLEELFEG